MQKKNDKMQKNNSCHSFSTQFFQQEFFDLFVLLTRI